LTDALKFGLATPSNLWKLDWQQRQQTVSQIAESGFDHIFMADHVSFRNGSGTDGFVEVAALSQLHPTLGVMTGIYLLPLRHPLPIARQLASMANLAPGRMIFGVGIGGEDPHELEVCGVNPKRRGVRANESLAIIKGLLAGETVTFQGKEFDVQDAIIRPTVTHTRHCRRQVRCCANPSSNLRRRLARRMVFGQSLFPGDAKRHRTGRCARSRRC
jgi:alkanesulfonate monooxygenase SsuD/methylene tetrahydromethanopterin reductase-like flavin-dependent oxidoreductase (luciferase family)